MSIRTLATHTIAYRARGSSPAMAQPAPITLGFPSATPPRHHALGSRAPDMWERARGSEAAFSHRTRRYMRMCSTSRESRSMPRTTSLPMSVILSLVGIAATPSSVPSSANTHHVLGPEERGRRYACTLVDDTFHGSSLLVSNMPRARAHRFALRRRSPARAATAHRDTERTLVFRLVFEPTNRRRVERESRRLLQGHASPAASTGSIPTPPSLLRSRKRAIQRVSAEMP